jgi:hypothetical protein
MKTAKLLKVGCSRFSTSKLCKQLSPIDLGHAQPPDVKHRQPGSHTSAAATALLLPALLASIVIQHWTLHQQQWDFVGMWHAHVGKERQHLQQQSTGTSATPISCF